MRCVLNMGTAPPWSPAGTVLLASSTSVRAAGVLPPDTAVWLLTADRTSADA